MTDDEIMVELEAQLLEGNHQAATLKPEEFKKKLNCDVKYGFAISINKETVRRILVSKVQAYM